MSETTKHITDVVEGLMDKIEAWNNDETAVLYSESTGAIPLGDKSRELIHTTALLCLLAEAGALALDLLVEAKEKQEKQT